MPVGQRPSHYISIQLHDRALQSKLIDVQQSLASQCATLVKTTDTARALQHLHITIALFDLKQHHNPHHAVADIANAVAEVQPRIQRILDKGVSITNHYAHSSLRRIV